MMITAIEPKVSVSGRYSVTETCSMSGIYRDTLLNCMRSGFIKYGPRND